MNSLFSFLTAFITQYVIFHPSGYGAGAISWTLILKDCMKVTKHNLRCVLDIVRQLCERWIGGRQKWSQEV